MKQDTAPLQEGIAGIGAKAALCVRCGLCLPACPTYQLGRTESESPRGRIALADSLRAGAPIAKSTREHLASCLACGACESACPSQVPFLDLLSETRALIGAAKRESVRRRVARFLLERPELTRWLKPLLHLIRPQWRLLRRARVVRWRKPQSLRLCNEGNVVVLLPGCSGDLLEASVLSAVEVLLRRCGYEVVRAPALCCGALAKHSGAIERSAQLMKRLKNAISSERAVTCTGVTSGCAEELAKGLSPQLRFQDPMELLWARRSRLRFRATSTPITLHLPCTQRRDPAAVTALKSILALVPGLQIGLLPDRGTCCGAAGSYFLDFPATARSLSARSVVGMTRGSEELLLSANAGCRLQLAQSLGAPTLHPLEFLVECLEPGP